LFAQLIADVKLLYNVDIQLISTGLLALKDKLIIESMRRNKTNGDLVQSYKMRLEETLSQDIQDGINFHSPSSVMHSHIVVMILSVGLYDNTFFDSIASVLYNYCSDEISPCYSFLTSLITVQLT